jgi:hypothetical protein
MDFADLEGSGLRDCCTVFWCPCCETVQMRKQLEYEKLNQESGPLRYQLEPQMNAVSQS